MSSLENKNILLGITGSIAAYKAAFLARRMMREGANVRIVITPAAEDFITPLTLSTLTGKPVINSLSTDTEWHNHIKWGRWADLFLIAPITAHTLAKMSQGLADNMLTACYLSCEAPVFVAPAMDVDMWNHPSTNRNVNQVEEDGVNTLPPATGALASGLAGTGRMMEVDDIVGRVKLHFSQSNDSLRGKSVLITAGPTREALDPVRYLTNAASGMTGIALAEEAYKRGADVSIVMGPTDTTGPFDDIEVHRVVSAQEMYETTEKLFADFDIIIFCAAVSDYRPTEQSEQKLKKSADQISLELEQTPDIARTLSHRKKSSQFTVGFALESENGEKNARKKLREKNFDMIVLNYTDTGMGKDENRVMFLFPNNKSQNFEFKSKGNIAIDLLDAVDERIKENT